MQAAIVTGRLIRDRVNISLKTPLSRVVLVDCDPQVLADYRAVEHYILDELNCMELVTEQEEDKFVDYKCEPDNKEIGSVLKKAYDKKLKQEISSLPSAQLRTYLHEGTITVSGHTIKEGWLKVEKVFKPEYQNSNEFACASNMTSAVMLRTVLDDNLKLLGQQREVTNRIQKLRKSSGVSIDDQIEVFYRLRDGQQSVLSKVINQHSDKIRGAIKMPFFHEDYRQAHQVVLGETQYEHDGDEITIFVCKQAIHVDLNELAKTGANVDSLRSILNSYDVSALRNQVESNSGRFNVRLDGKDVELLHKTHFYIGARERQ